MSIFDKRQKEQQPENNDAEIGVTYDQVVDFLVSVNDKDYAKIFRVADIYRQANVEVAKATGVKAEQNPSIFARQSFAPIVLKDQPSLPILADDDELMKAFEGSEPDEVTEPVKKTKVRRKGN